MRCARCFSRNFSPWSVMKQERLDKPGKAVASMLLRGVKHMVVGDFSVPFKLEFDERSTDLKKCDGCGNVYLVCPCCEELIPVDMAAITLDRTVLDCPGCGKKILFAGDYTAGGG